MASLTDRSPASPGAPSPRRTLFALGGGNAVEWYDWMVYGLLASYLGPQFFPSTNPLSATLSALAVFAVGFAARPVGALVFGTLADRVGRRRIMLLSIGGMVVSTAVIAVLPTHDSIGVWAGVILVACRIVQGISTGIEAPLNSAYVVEMAPEGRTARYGGIISVYVQSGIIAASLVAFVTSTVLGATAMEEWGWRIPFAVGAVGGAVFLRLRRSLPETLHTSGEAPAASRVWADVGRNKLALLAIVFVVAGAQALNYTWSTGLPNLARTVHGENPSAVFAVSTLSGLCVAALYPLVGRLADRKRISRTFLVARLAAVPLVFAVLLYQAPGMVLFTVVMMIGAPVLAFTMGLYTTVSATLMPMSCRVTGVGIGYAVGVAGFGGTAPYILLWLQDIGLFWVFPVYVAVLCLLSALFYTLAFRRGSVRVGG
ncbi:Alpha-ketoglutarate permease [Streptomyces sp. ADI96-02]|uniref:MFS transporter n=1 Tax=unclassified Streptomyces TaxID=2593676 RepID=UPI000F55326D|nr:MFS transporter [Streptomyces sp. ADI96-02]RPK54579.1 Alpha-ketoglutarate permease [Streptomyces sp. ADI96-02]